MQLTKKKISSPYFTFKVPNLSSFLGYFKQKNWVSTEDKVMFLTSLEITVFFGALELKCLNMFLGEK